MGAGISVARFAVLAASVTASCLSACGGGASVAGLGVVARASPVVAFISDATSVGHSELFVCNADGSSRRKVSGPLGIGGGVSRFAWSPDRHWIAFLDDKSFPGQHDLYVVDPLGETPTLISGQPTFGKDLYSLRWSPDSSKIAVGGSLGMFADDVLAAIPAAGGPIATLTPPGVHPTYSDAWWWSPDSTAVAFLGHASAGPSEFYIAEADGSASPVVSGSLVPGGSIDIWFTEAWSPDGARVAFRGDRLTVGKVELFTAKRDGTGLAKVSHTLVANEHVSTYAWSPVSARLAYVSAPPGVASQSRLYAVDGAGGTVVPVSAADEDALTFAWRPDGTGIAYDALATGALRLGDPTFGGSSLLAALDPDDDRFDYDFAWSPNGARLAYRSGGLAGPPSNEAYRLFSVAPGGAPALLSTSVGAGDGDVPRYAWQWSPDGQSVAYRGRPTQFGPRTVFTAPAAGGGDDPVSTPGLDAGDHDLGWSADGARLVWEERTGPGFDRLMILEAGTVDTLAAPAHPYSSIFQFLLR